MSKRDFQTDSSICDLVVAALFDGDAPAPVTRLIPGHLERCQSCGIIAAGLAQRSQISALADRFAPSPQQSSLWDELAAAARTALSHPQPSLAQALAREGGPMVDAWFRAAAGDAADEDLSDARRALCQAWADALAARPGEEPREADFLRAITAALMTAFVAPGMWQWRHSPLSKLPPSGDASPPARPYADMQVLEIWNAVSCRASRDPVDWGLTYLARMTVPADLAAHALALTHGDLVRRQAALNARLDHQWRATRHEVEPAIRVELDHFFGFDA